ncbi:MAG: transposase [Steroidobacteraceae bacterium]
MWFQDEARVGQKGTHAYIWAPIGSRPPMVRDNRHESAYLYGAICPARGVGAAVIMPAANTEGMNEQLKELSTQLSPGAHAAVICDGAGWHQLGGKLKVPANITLVPLPPYAPELVWGLPCQALNGSFLRNLILPHTLFRVIDVLQSEGSSPL